MATPCLDCSQCKLWKINGTYVGYCDAIQDLVTEEDNSISMNCKEIVKDIERRKEFKYTITTAISVITGIILFFICHDYATYIRGYESIGGEMFVIFIPAIITVTKYVIFKTIDGELD